MRHQLPELPLAVTQRLAACLVAGDVLQRADEALAAIGGVGDTQHALAYQALASVVQSQGVFNFNRVGGAEGVAVGFEQIQPIDLRNQGKEVVEAGAAPLLTENAHRLRRKGDIAVLDPHLPAADAGNPLCGGELGKRVDTLPDFRAIAVHRGFVAEKVVVSGVGIHGGASLPASGLPDLLPIAASSGSLRILTIRMNSSPYPQNYLCALGFSRIFKDWPGA